MTENKKAAIKTFLVFIGLFLLEWLVMKIFDLHRILFKSFLFDREFYGSLFWRLFVLLFTLGFSGIMSLLGYRIARRKHRNAQNWAGLCFLLNIWGVIFLSFLPPIEEDQR